MMGEGGLGLVGPIGDRDLDDRGGGMGPAGPVQDRDSTAGGGGLALDRW